ENARCATGDLAHLGLLGFLAESSSIEISAKNPPAAVCGRRERVPGLEVGDVAERGGAEQHQGSADVRAHSAFALGELRADIADLDVHALALEAADPCG